MSSYKQRLRLNTFGNESSSFLRSDDIIQRFLTGQASATIDVACKVGNYFHITEINFENNNHLSEQYIYFSGLENESNLGQLQTALILD